jgi:hypothetical protein
MNGTPSPSTENYQGKRGRRGARLENMVDMGKYITMSSSTFPHLIRKSIIKKKKMNKNMTTTTTTDRIQSSSVVSSNNASHSSPRSVTNTDRMKHSIYSDASKCSVEIVPCPPSHVIAADEDDDNNDQKIDYSSPRRTTTVHNDRLLHSLGCFGQQFITGVIRRLFASPASVKYGITTNAVYTIGNMVRAVCEYELPFELSEEVYLNTINDDDSSCIAGITAVAWRVHSRVDQLWAGIEHSLDRWVVDCSSSNASSKSSSSSIQSSSTGPILNGPMAIKLVEKIVHSTLWEMGIHSLRFDIGINDDDDDDDSALCSDTRTTTGWTTPRGAFGCCQCTPLESL